MLRPYLTDRFFIVAGLLVVSIVVSFSYPVWYPYAVGLMGVFFLLAFAEYFFLLFASKRVSALRSVKSQLSLGDRQSVDYTIQNRNGYNLNAMLVDELPFQLQHRQQVLQSKIFRESELDYNHEIKPTERGIYDFGRLMVYLTTPWLGLLKARIICQEEERVAVYPSFIQMKNMEMQVFSQTANLAGIRKVREIGENDEFEQIRNYVVGDNVKSINWKATSRNNDLMVNQYENSKSQSIYCIIDKGRSMKMPFDELTLLDYAINTSLVTSNIVLKKYDRIGLITFANKIGSILNADAQKGQLQKIIRLLYDQKTDFGESNFKLLFHTLRERVRRRSILLLFTNFEHPQEMKRNMLYLKSLNRNHLLVVIFFQNEEIEKAAHAETKTTDELYFKTFAQESIMQKERMMSELRRNGIQVILSRPQDLSVNTINKYLEIKAKRMK